MCGTGTWPWPATVVGFVICDGEIWVITTVGVSVSSVQIIDES